MHISPFDIEILQALSRGHQLKVTSSHRLRLEMLKLVADTANGLRLTPLGEAAARGQPNTTVETFTRTVAKVDAIGRRKSFERQYG